MNSPKHPTSGVGPAPPAARPGPTQPPHWDSTTLLQGATRTFITHRGETYCLQLTRQGKLILTK
jgi:hemin uptake protein HemP